MTHAKGGRTQPQAIFLLAAGALAAGLCDSPYVHGAEKIRLTIAPGPTVMSEEERAIQPDLSSGAEHAVILVEESDLDESGSTYNRLTFHLRAKILSNEGRELANIQIPYNRNAGYLKNWWGRTLLPDGAVVELKQDQLSEQTVARVGGRNVAVLKAALPGVLPGCVIDYGYTIDRSEFDPPHRVTLQRAWPMRRFRFRWRPWGGIAAWFHVTRAQGMAVTVNRDTNSVLITGENLPAVVEEPWAPPEDQTRAMATLYYSKPADDRNDFWNTHAKNLDREVRYWIADDRPLKQILPSMEIPADGGLHAKLRAAYDWLNVNVANRRLRPEDRDDAPRKGGKKPRTDMRTLLEEKAGWPWQLDYLYVAVARSLGAEANLVQVVDRRERYWDPRFLSTEQFDGRLVAVRAPGEADDKAVMVDAGSGLSYGEVPWWYTGMKALMVLPKEGREIMIWPPEVRESMSENEIQIDFSGEGGSARNRWTRKWSGQHGLAERYRLLRLEAAGREKVLRELCGLNPRFDVTRASVGGLEDPRAALVLSCEGELLEDGPDESISEYHFSFLGPWIDYYPEFTAPTRVHPVVLPFRRVDIASLRVTPPPGFAPGAAAPPPVKLDSAHGRYSLSIQPSGSGFEVQRMFALFHLAVPPEEYETLRSFFADVRGADRTYLPFQRTQERP